MSNATLIIPLDQTSRESLSLESGLQDVGLNLHWLIHQAVLSLDPYLTDEEAVYGLNLVLIDHYSQCQFPYTTGADRTQIQNQFLQYRQTVYPYILQCQRQYPENQYRIQVDEIDYHGQTAIRLALQFEDVDDLPPTDTHSVDTELLRYLESEYQQYVSSV